MGRSSGCCTATHSSVARCRPSPTASNSSTAPALGAAFDALAPSHRKEHVRPIDEAKKPETRANRVAACVAKVSG
jgi:uncharacterized protein YdeI (YjbR/CyaY-like superfamily)